MGCKFLGADTIVLGASGSCPATLPGEPESDRLPVFRQPRVANASANQNVIATGSNSADFVIFVRQHDGIEDSSIRIGDGHRSICVPRISRTSIIFGPVGNVTYRTKFNFACLGHSGAVSHTRFQVFFIENKYVSKQDPISPLYRVSRRYEFSPHHQFPAAPAWLYGFAIPACNFPRTVVYC